jgi:hypothetical protein
MIPSTSVVARPYEDNLLISLLDPDKLGPASGWMVKTADIQHLTTPSRVQLQTGKGSKKRI